THENLLASRGIGRPRSSVRPFDPHLTDVRIKQESRNRSRSIHRALERTIELSPRHIIRSEERHANCVQSSLNRNLLRGATIARGVGNFFIPIKKPDALAVDRDFKLLTLHSAEHRLKVSSNALHLKRILAVSRKLVLDQNAAASPEGQPFDVIVLRR